MATLYIKNMCCPRCIQAVGKVLGDLGLVAESITLGEAVVEGDVSDNQYSRIRTELQALGFDLLGDPQMQLVEKIRTSIMEWVRIEGDRPNVSTFLQQTLNKDYSVLSKLFSAMRGITIERYCILMRVELAKELLRYSDKTVSELAFQLGYSSAAHFSAQFRHETGMSPSVFRNSKEDGRRFLDEL